MGVWAFSPGCWHPHSVGRFHRCTTSATTALPRREYLSDNLLNIDHYRFDYFCSQPLCNGDEQGESRLHLSRWAWLYARQELCGCLAPKLPTLSLEGITPLQPPSFNIHSRRGPYCRCRNRNSRLTRTRLVPKLMTDFGKHTKIASLRIIFLINSRYKTQLKIL